MTNDNQNDKEIKKEETVQSDSASAQSQERKDVNLKDRPSADNAAPDDKAAPEDEAKAAGSKPSGRIKGSRAVYNGTVNIQATFNNTIVSIADPAGAVIAWSSGGRMGFKGSRKSTAYAATMIAQDAARQAVSRGMREVEIRVQGPGSGRESAIRAIQGAGLNISVITDVTPIPHNGCRPRKRRRV